MKIKLVTTKIVNGGTVSLIIPTNNMFREYYDVVRLNEYGAYFYGGIFDTRQLMVDYDGRPIERK